MRGKDRYNLIHSSKPQRDPTKEEWKAVYRLARTPDAYLADNVTLGFPVRWLLMAIECLEQKTKGDQL